MTVPHARLQLRLQLRITVGVEGRQLAQAALAMVVVGQLQRHPRQQQDGRQIGDGHQRHGSIRHFPHQRQLRQCAEHHHAQRHAAENDQAARVVVLEEYQVALGIGVVGDDRGKGEEEDGDGDERRPQLPTAVDSARWVRSMPLMLSVG